jgi:MFS family permease
MWGVFGATYFLFAVQELHLDAAAIGVVAAVGGFSSLVGALLTPRLTRRFGVGRVLLGGILVGMLGNYFIPFAPVGVPLITMAFLIGQQLVTDPSMTAFDITDTSLRQSIVRDHQLGRVNATVRVAVLTAQLAATLLAGFLAVQIGLRTMLVIGPAIGLLGLIALWFSPVRRLRRIEDVAQVDLVEPAT